MKAAEAKAFADFEMLEETQDDASKYTDEYLQKLQDINAELKSNKYPRITNKSQLESKKEQLNNLNERVNEITTKIPHIDKAEQDNQIAKKILEYLKEEGK